MVVGYRTSVWLHMGLGDSCPPGTVEQALGPVALDHKGRRSHQVLSSAPRRTTAVGTRMQPTVRMSVLWVAEAGYTPASGSEEVTGEGLRVIRLRAILAADAVGNEKAAATSVGVPVWAQGPVEHRWLPTLRQARSSLHYLQWNRKVTVSYSN